MKFNLSQKEVTAFQGTLMLGHEDEDAVVDEYAKKLIERTEENESAPSGKRLSWDAARSLLRSLKPVSKDVYLARIDCCSNCEHVRILAGRENSDGRTLYQCSKCLCIMNAKALLPASNCPIGRF